MVIVVRPAVVALLVADHLASPILAVHRHPDDRFGEDAERLRAHHLRQPDRARRIERERLARVQRGRLHAQRLLQLVRVVLLHRRDPLARDRCRHPLDDRIHGPVEQCDARLRDAFVDHVIEHHDRRGALLSEDDEARRIGQQPLAAVVQQVREFRRKEVHTRNCTGVAAPDGIRLRAHLLRGRWVCRVARRQRRTAVAGSS